MRTRYRLTLHIFSAPEIPHLLYTNLYKKKKNKSSQDCPKIYHKMWNVTKYEYHKMWNVTKCEMLQNRISNTIKNFTTYKMLLTVKVTESSRSQHLKCHQIWVVSKSEMKMHSISPPYPLKIFSISLQDPLKITLDPLKLPSISHEMPSGFLEDNKKGHQGH